jgi:hypothetical protein
MVPTTELGDRHEGSRDALPFLLLQRSGGHLGRPVSTWTSGPVLSALQCKVSLAKPGSGKQKACH